MLDHVIYSLPAFFLLIACCAQNQAKAADLPAAEYKQIYLDSSSGRQMEAHEAILAAVKGQTVYKCQTVEAKISKSGTSIGVRNVKKPKAN